MCNGKRLENVFHSINNIHMFMFLWMILHNNHELKIEKSKMLNFLLFIPDIV